MTADRSTPTRTVTADDVNTDLCVVAGVAHDFRPRAYRTCYNTDRTSWVCVWCNGVACGDYDEPDPCWLVYHHPTPHLSRTGVAWPPGGSRQEAPHA